uniref:Mannan endo-1,4-beta-mannosidase n=2 Tax=Cryptopygus antarcticus TaxID=187623 RepID=MANA_CRYAT|nr:RecName: Full=Mannan endo-1,4-beta-mannosidase; AltName: Full=Beta-mannanase; AltName: Full=CaMan; AltName: Full=Endo-beta-1,4-D-mannanase; Flags: Precursor [Cryptopygus antarcticus]ABV68808.1 beta-1,4-mannanase precursor [Cryptopygus antarcticus]
MVKLFSFLLLVWVASPAFSSEFLKASGSNFYYGGQKVFLSGVNFAWRSYGSDFGNGQYASNGPALKDWINKVKASGGNTARVWVHVEGQVSPAFDSHGFVTSTDSKKTLINDLSDLLDYANGQNVFLILVLFNGALQNNSNVQNLFWDESKLNSYINNALTPMVNALKSKPSLAAWEVLNEPEGTLQPGSDQNSCYDTSTLAAQGAGWGGKKFPMKQILKTINWISSAIHNADSKALVTVGSWSELTQTDSFGYRNHYKDSCLTGAGGKSNGIINFYQMHTYSHSGKWNQNAPFKVNRWAYNVNDKPLLIGEFASVCSQNEGIQNLYKYAYNNGYNGALTWQFNSGGDCSDTYSNQMYGMQALKGQNDQSGGKGGMVSVNIN